MKKTYTNLKLPDLVSYFGITEISLSWGTNTTNWKLIKTKDKLKLNLK